MSKSKLKQAMTQLRAETQHRELAPIDLRALDEDARSVEVAFSSTAPVERWYGYEILEHTNGAVRMSRMKNGAPLLLNHRTDEQIGVVRSARIDGDGVGRAEVQFSRSARGEEIWRDVQDGIRQKMSVGYRVHNYEVEQAESDIDTVRITDWEPYEISIVAVPADDQVGVGRTAESFNEENTMTKESKQSVTEPTGYQPEPQPERSDKTAAPPTPDAERAAVQPQETNPEHEQIRALGRKYKVEELASEYIDFGRSLADFQTAMWKERQSKLRPVPSVVEPRIEVRAPRRSTLKAFSNDRHGEESAYRAGMWARAVLFNDANAQRWCQDYGVRVMTGLSSGTSSVVPEELVLPIIDLRERYGIARRYCNIHPMSSDTATVPRRKSGVTAYFVGRTDATTASDMAFDQINLVAREVAAMTLMANSYAADAVINLADQLADEMAYAFAVKEDDCLFNGDGSSTYGGIYGIRAKIIDGNHSVGAVDAASGHDTFAEIDADDLLGVKAVLPMFAGIMPRWFISKAGNSLVFDALKAAAGGNTQFDLSGRPILAYLGDEIVISQSMPTSTGDLSDVVMAIYGDLNLGVTFGDRQGFELEISRDRYFEYRQTAIQAVERFDIVVHGLGDTSTAGPVVALVGE